ncbi:hypothetical protein SPONL_1637 [uncultured Candidatus Thioglobus sp.]|nr:hypothetical protein SPONL_1637 [uncultured Candidatus Thioglobus sp.]
MKNMTDFNKIIEKLLDKEVRGKLLSNNPDRALLAEFGYQIDADTQVKVVASTKKVTYIVMSDDSIDLDLANVSAAGCQGTFSTAGSLCSSLSTAGSSSTI